MGLSFKKIAKSASGYGIVGAPIAKKLGLPSFKDLLLGEKDGDNLREIPVDPDIKRTQDQARALQREGLTALTQNLGDPTQIAQSQITGEQQALRGSFGDARRRLQSLVAARGLRGSSIGLGQEVGLQRGQSRELGQLQASLPERIRQLKLARSQAQIGGAGQVLGLPGLQRDIAVTDPSRRQGGILPLITAGVGGYFGGPAGAQAGYGAGQYASGSFG